MGTRRIEHILIVESDPFLSETLRAALEHSGFVCDTATGWASAFDLLKQGDTDAVVGDLGSPGCDDIELISMVRRTSDVPLIVMSERCPEADKVAAFDAGADDYVERPFFPGELVARVRAKLRQSQRRWTDETDGDAPEFHLSRMERALLALLVQHQGATVSESAIIDALWGPDGRATSVDLRVLVLKLRRKLEEQHQPLFVFNERGVGYYVSGWGRFRRRISEALRPQSTTALPDGWDTKAAAHATVISLRPQRA